MADEEVNKEETVEEVEEEKEEVTEEVVETAETEATEVNEVMDFLGDLKGIILNLQETVEKMNPPVETPEPALAAETVEPTTTAPEESEQDLQTDLIKLED